VQPYYSPQISAPKLDYQSNINRAKPQRLHEKMELAAKLRHEELEKDKKYKLMQNRIEHRPIDQNELRRH